jgi:hypothetical protein
MTYQSCCGAPNYSPVPIPPLRAGEIDGRYIDTSTDLGVVGDKIIDISTVRIAINRADGEIMTAGDLRLAGNNWPNTLDSTGFVITVGFDAPPDSASVPYWVTLTINQTYLGRLYIRDLTMTVAPILG